MTNRIEQETTEVRNTWGEVGHFLAMAMREVAAERGGEECADLVMAATASEDVLPSSAALELLEEIFPGVSEAVFVRMQAIQQVSNRRELDEATKPSVCKSARAVLEAFRITSRK